MFYNSIFNRVSKALALGCVMNTCTVIIEKKICAAISLENSRTHYLLPALTN